MLASLDQFDRAIQLDPNYALAYVGKADTYMGLADGYMAPDITTPKALVLGRTESWRPCATGV